MLVLTRTVRLCLNDPPAPPTAPADSAQPTKKEGGECVYSGGRNTFSAWPAMCGLGRYYQVHVTAEGEPDPLTGFLINIKDVDQAVRESVLPYLGSLLPAPDLPLGEVMRQVLRLIAPLRPRKPHRRNSRRPPSKLPGVTAVRLDLTPYYSVGISRRDMSHVLIRQQFEFAAAHRLHMPRLSAAANRRLFDKCNNPAGHGHNYRLEVAVRAPIGPTGQTLHIETLDAIVDRHAIQALDHKHLNIDVPAFKRLNPTVENIAKVIFGMLSAPLRRVGAELAEVSVWETSKTVCTYRGRMPAGRPRGG